MEARNEAKKTGSRRSRRQWSSSLRKLFRRRSFTSASTVSGTATDTDTGRREASFFPSIEGAVQDSSDGCVHIPDTVWSDNVFPFLDRWSQNRLAEACRAVAVARPYHQSMQWPATGRINPKLFPRGIHSLAFSSNEQHLIVTMVRSRKVMVYDKLRGPQKPLKGHTGHVIDAKFAPADGENAGVLATAGRNDGTIRLWKLNDDNNKGNYECFRVLQTYQNDLRHLIWSPDGQWIASWGSEGFVRVTRVSDGRLYSRFWKTRLEVVGCHETVVFGPDSKSLTFAFNNEVVRLWEFANTDRIRVLPGSSDLARSYDGTYVTSIAYSPDYRYLAVGCHVAAIKLWVVTAPNSDDDDDDESNTNDNSDSPFYYHDFEREIGLGAGWSAVTLIQFTQDSQYIACTGNGSQIRLVQVSTGNVVGVLSAHTSRVEALCFSSCSLSDGDNENDSRQNIVLASGGRDRNVRLWDMSKYMQSQR